jgi:hypothetical protein
MKKVLPVIFKVIDIVSAVAAILKKKTKSKAKNVEDENTNAVN